MECAEVLLQMLHCTVLRCAYGANSGELMVNLFNICIPLPQLDLIYNMDHVSFLFNRGWVNHKLHNNRVEGKVKWITRSEYDVLPTTRSNDCFKQLCQKPQDGRSRNTPALGKRRFASFRLSVI